MTALVIGVDEVGRGPLAGPVVAAAVVLPVGFSDSRVDDSKKLAARVREQLSDEIKNEALAWSIVAVGHHRIVALNILEATRLAMRLCIRRVVRSAPEARVLIDGNMLVGSGLVEEAIVGGDGLVPAISAASIIAKTYRDALMTRLARRFPLYGFERHAGYPTAQHREAIARYGPCAVHRNTFRGVREYLQIGTANKKPDGCRDTNL